MQWQKITIMNEHLNNKLLCQDFCTGKGLGLESYKEIAAGYALAENAIAVLSDLRTDSSHIFYGGFGEFLGLAPKGTYCHIDSIWENDIFSRIRKEDLEKKNLDELQFFDFVRQKGKAQTHFMTNQISMMRADGSMVKVLHRIIYFNESEAVRFALCLYTPMCGADICSSITDSMTGENILLENIDAADLLSAREKEVLKLIDEGMSSKEIASHLNISIYTVSRHRQNILEKLRARNSAHACRTAKQLKLV